jgi:adenosylcobinamide kinase / adenosylcobinamide-phosphate guanylyltransferase
MTHPQSKTQQQITLVTGPASSGKSEWAEYLAAARGKAVSYVATARVDCGDREWLAKIEKHAQRRPPHWETLLTPVELPATIRACEPSSCLLVDSLGTWVANLLSEEERTWEKRVEDLLESLQVTSGEVILVAEETGWGVVPAYPAGRIFRDRLGQLTRKIGAIAIAVYLVTGGYALNLSQLGMPLPANSNL